MEQSTKLALLVILQSPDGRGGWQMVKPEDVPEWVKAPENIRRLAEERVVCMKADAEGKPGAWYCGRSPEEAAMIMRAQVKRERRSSIRVAVARRLIVAARDAVKH